MDVRKSGYKDINWFVYKFLPESWKYHSRGKLVFKGPLLDFHDCGRCRLSTSKNESHDSWMVWLIDFFWGQVFQVKAVRL